MRPRLGVNVDHIATVRNARGTSYPDPVEGARIALQTGADGITIHLREDRRHIRDDDVRRMRELVKGKKLNLEMALTEEMVRIAQKVKPDYVCLVPERRQEMTTERGLSFDEVYSKRHLLHAVRHSGIKISLFMSPNAQDIARAIQNIQPNAIELHTGEYAQAMEASGALDELTLLDACGKMIMDGGIECHAGHGLNLDNIESLCGLYLFEEYNIGHAIVAQSVFESLEVVVKKYLHLFEKYPVK